MEREEQIALLALALLFILAAITAWNHAPITKEVVTRMFETLGPLLDPFTEPLEWDIF